MTSAPPSPIIYLTRLRKRTDLSTPPPHTQKKSHLGAAPWVRGELKRTHRHQTSHATEDNKTRDCHSYQIIKHIKNTHYINKYFIS